MTTPSAFDNRKELAERWTQTHAELERLEDLRAHRTGDALVDFG